MSKAADYVRDQRRGQRGQARLTARISGVADDALALLANHYHLPRREVVQTLLLAAQSELLRHDDSQVISIMHDHRMSHAEAQLFQQMRKALPMQLNQQDTING